MSKLSGNPYGPSHQEIQEQKKNEKMLNEETNLLLKEIVTELKSLSNAVASITKHLDL